MPIYAYRCESCGHAKDVLQKVSDPVLSVCPSCGADAFRKQVTAAGFQLKGSGWYVTDFRGGNGGAAKPTGDGKPADPKSDGAKTESTPATATATAAADSAAGTPAAGGCGGSCACH